MNPGIFSTLLLLAPFVACGQTFADDFSDGEFTSNPTWTGDTTLFAVHAGELQLRDLSPPSSGTAYLAAFAPTALGLTSTWEFYVRLQFAPSTSNFARFYLTSDMQNLEGALNGYFLRIGGVSGDTDALELYRQTGLQTQLLFSGSPGAVAEEPAIARVRITRNTEGSWQMAADYSGGQNLVPQGNPVFDTTHRSGEWTGFYCRYSASRAQSFFWDDVRISPLFEDTIPPVLMELDVPDSRRIMAIFNEPLDTAANFNLANFSLLPEIGMPQRFQHVVGQPNALLLEWDIPMDNLQTYTFICEGVRDRHGNLSVARAISFTFYDIQPALPGDILLTEIMADPNPVVSGLPDAEYVEVYNASNKVIDMGKLFFSAGGSPRPIQGGLSLPGTYAIVCTKNFEARFSVFGTTATVDPLPNLGNESGTIKITDIQNNIILEVNYSSTWYRDENRAAGGWSLELVELDKPCDCPSNWRACVDPRGGSPGIVNSISGLMPDRTGPSLISAVVAQARQVNLHFDETLDAECLTTDLFSVLEGIPISSILLQGDGRSVRLELAAPLLSGQSNTLLISENLKDCLGNGNSDSRSVRLGLPEAISPGDLVVNEILFNPVTGGDDFVEFYNISGKVLNMNGLHVWNRSRPGNSFVRIESDWVLFPGDYVALTPNRSSLLALYPESCASCILEHPLPALDDESGNVTLMNGTELVDAFDYSETQHSPLLKRLDGVSLERIDPSKSAEIAENWHSAAQNVGFATPGYRNSQFQELNQGGAEVFVLLPETLTPDGDGYQDLVSIVFSPGKSGALLTAVVLDISGRPVKALASNILCGPDNLLKWDGSDDDGAIVRSGFYLIRASWFFPDGARGNAQKICVVGR
jgi:hypothetical protein